MIQAQEIPINKITITGKQPRKNFKDASLKELSASIKKDGVIQPVLVRPNGSPESFELIAGERRVRASIIAGLVTIPAIIRQDSNENILRLQIIENLQRENVSYFEEAEAIKIMREELSLDTTEICKMLGKSEAYVYNQLSLTKLPKEAQEAFANNYITKGVAWQIARLPNTEYQLEAVSTLARKNKSKLISSATAERFLRDRFSEQRVSKPMRNFAQKTDGNDYAANWKKYLLEFDCRQFEKFKSIVRNRTETSVLAEAVEAVKLELK